jgi:elongation factor 1 alpha-like protein
MHKYEQESKKVGKQSFAYAWVLDETAEERERGITMDVGQSHFTTPTKSVTLLDAPGHKDFIPNMISGAYQADVAILVVNATTGEFEAGFEAGGQTREHALLVRSLGVSQLAVAVNKLDTVDWSKQRFDDVVGKLRHFLKSVGFRDSDVTYVPCSGFTGDNLISASTNLIWHEGPTLLQAIDKFR